jgi:hypothetical protein
VHVAQMLLQERVDIGTSGIVDFDSHAGTVLLLPGVPGKWFAG